MPIIRQICGGAARTGLLGTAVPSPRLRPQLQVPQEYHEQRQDEDDGASQVGVLVWPELVLRAVNELKRHFLLWRAPDAAQTPGHRRGRADAGVEPRKVQQTAPGSPAASPGPRPTRTGPSAGPRGPAAASRSPGTPWLQTRAKKRHHVFLGERGLGLEPRVQGAGVAPELRLPPSAHGDSPHRAMKIAKSTVPSLSKRCVSWGEGCTGLGAAFRCPPCPQRGRVSPALQGRPSASPPPGRQAAGSKGAANLGKGAGVRELLVPTAMVAARAQKDVVGLTDLLAERGATTGLGAALPGPPHRARPPFPHPT